MGKTVSTIKGVRKDAYFDRVLADATSPETALATIKAEVRFAGVLNTAIPRGHLVRRVPAAPEESDAISAANEVEKKFDPFSIHTLNLAKRGGVDAVREALVDITHLDQLAQIAVAQRLAIAPFDPGTPLEDAREAIATAAAQRVADRKAATA
ncbi:MAG: hypothetical protein AAFQ35_01610 [Pseudomonadota bacterium]